MAALPGTTLGLVCQLGQRFWLLSLEPAIALCPLDPRRGSRCLTTLPPVLGPRPSLRQGPGSSEQVLSVHPHYPPRQGIRRRPSLCWIGKPCQAPPQLPGHAPSPGEGWGMPREVAGMAVVVPRQPGPTLRAGSWASARPRAPHPHPARVPSPCQCGAPSSWFRQLTNPAMQSGSLIANSFYGSWAHLCHHMQREKKNPFKKISPCPTPQTDSKRNSCQGFSGCHQAQGWGASCGVGLAVGGPGGAGLRGPPGACLLRGGDGLSQLPAVPGPPGVSLGPGPWHRSCSCSSTGCPFPDTSLLLSVRPLDQYLARSGHHTVLTAM